MKKALLLGSTGLIGSHLLDLLIHDDHYEEVNLFVRNKSEMTSPKLRQIVMHDFHQMREYKEHFQVDDVFCCLGTTIKKAKTKEQFKQVDFTFPLIAAEIAKEMGVARFLLVSAMGANRHSNIFYNRTKGEVEKAIQDLHLPAFYIFRPSLLLGKRKEFRLAERVSTWVGEPLSFLLRGALLKYRPIQAMDVAAVMYRMAQTFLPGTQVFENDQMVKLLSLPQSR